MQDLSLIRPGRTADGELSLDLGKAALKQEFEERLAECGTLAFRVARGVLRNADDAEDVAQEALLRAYRRFARPRDPARFRAWVERQGVQSGGLAERFEMSVPMRFGS